MDEKKRADYVERLARVLEAQGEPRILGRIYGQLMTAAEPYLSLQQLADQLRVSRGSVSTNTRRLITMGLIAKVPVPGSRGEHYAPAPGGVRAMMERAAVASRELEGLMAEGLRLQPRSVTAGTQHLREMAAFYARMAEDLEAQLRAPKRKVAR
jgi:DNA-binding transcriptional regulator GbsR (MarR family)